LIGFRGKFPKPKRRGWKVQPLNVREWSLRALNLRQLRLRKSSFHVLILGEWRFLASRNRRPRREQKKK
jgi:hypothetical protein